MVACSSKKQLTEEKHVKKIVVSFSRGKKYIRVLLTSVPRVLFKHFKRRNYSIKKLNILIFNALNTSIFKEKLRLKGLNFRGH